MDQHPFRLAAERGDLAALGSMLSSTTVFHSPILSHELTGGELIAKVFTNAFEVFAPKITGEYRGEDGTIVVFEGAVGGHPVEMAVLVRDGENGTARELRVYGRPVQSVALFRDEMRARLGADIPAEYWGLAHA